MKKKDYLKPTIEIEQLQQEEFLLATSQGNEVQATMNDTWEEEDI